MSDETGPERTIIVWSPEARADIRVIERKTAMQILHCVDDYVSKRVGGVKKTETSAHRFSASMRRPQGLFDHKGVNSIEITGVKNRKEAYR